MCKKIMERLIEILQSGKVLSPETRQRIEEQLARAEEVRAQRQASPEKTAQKQALELFPHIRDLGIAMSNYANTGERALTRHILDGNPIPFVGFWGVGDKQGLDSFDERYLHRLEEKRTYVAARYQSGATFTFILADLHGIFNGFVSPDGESDYLNQVGNQLQQIGFRAVRLSELYAAHDLRLPVSTDAIDRLPGNEAYYVFISHREQYMRSAGNHHMRETEAEAAGYWYVAMRLQERSMLEQAFPNSFLLVNGTRMTAEPLMPKALPVIYLPEGPTWFRKEKPIGGNLP